MYDKNSATLGDKDGLKENMHISWNRDKMIEDSMESAQEFIGEDKLLLDR